MNNLQLTMAIRHSFERGEVDRHARAGMPTGAEIYPTAERRAGRSSNLRRIRPVACHEIPVEQILRPDSHGCRDYPCAAGSTG